MNTIERINNVLTEANILVKHRINTSNVKLAEFLEKIDHLLEHINSEDFEANSLRWVNINRLFEKLEQEFLSH